jgi:predicted porin
MAMLAGNAQAQSWVKISGFVDATVIRESGAANGTHVNKLSSGVSGPSRLLFTGEEDLGGGSSAFFHLETGILLDSGGSSQPNFFGRTSLVGLKGDWGALRLGNMFTPLWNTALLVADPFRVTSAANAGNLMTSAAAGGPNASGVPAGPNSSGNQAFNTAGSATGGITRANAISYSSPKLYGFQLETLYGLGEQAADSEKLRTYGVSLGYTIGKLDTRFAHQSTNDNGANRAGLRSQKSNLLAANYDFGFMRPYVAVGSNKGFGTIDNREYLVGLAIPLPVGLFRTSYIKKDDRSALNQDARQFGFGYTYPLSKRTYLHASWARIKNSNGAAYTVNSPAGPGTGTKAIAVGVAHSF